MKIKKNWKFRKNLFENIQKKNCKFRKNLFENIQKKIVKKSWKSCKKKSWKIRKKVENLAKKKLKNSKKKVVKFEKKVVNFEKFEKKSWKFWFFCILNKWYKHCYKIFYLYLPQQLFHRIPAGKWHFYIPYPQSFAKLKESNPFVGPCYSTVFYNHSKHHSIRSGPFQNASRNFRTQQLHMQLPLKRQFINMQKKNFFKYFSTKNFFSNIFQKNLFFSNVFPFFCSRIFNFFPTFFVQLFIVFSNYFF